MIKIGDTFRAVQPEDLQQGDICMIGPGRRYHESGLIDSTCMVNYVLRKVDKSGMNCPLCGTEGVTKNEGIQIGQPARCVNLDCPIQDFFPEWDGTEIAKDRLCGCGKLAGPSGLCQDCFFSRDVKKGSLTRPHRER